MRHLHYFDPQLVDLGGHYHTYCEQVLREMKRRNVAVTVYARKGCQVTCGGQRPEQVFSHDIFAEMCRDEQTWALENFHNANLAFMLDLSRINAERFSADDVLFFPSLLQDQMHGIANWLARLPEARRPAVVILLRYLNHKMDYVLKRPNHDLVRLHYRFAARAVQTVQPRMLLTTDTTEMAAAYHEITGLPVTELTIAMEPPAALPTPPPRATDGRPLVVFQGHTSKLKGFDLLPEIIERCLQSKTKPRFAVQVQNRQAAIRAGLSASLDRVGRLAGPDVRLVNGSLTTAAYYQLLQEADVVLLPYSPDFYGHCSSGIFAEAMAMGKVIVVPAGTVSARQAKEYSAGVVCAEDCSAPALATAVTTAIAQLPALRTKAESGAPKFKQEQSVQAFWDRLLAALSSRTAASSAAA
jgi:glycosyltransferase involved in cell wall biosynthesis